MTRSAPATIMLCMDTPEHLFRDFLRQRRLKYTTERLAILKMVQQFGRPFEAEELLLELRRRIIAPRPQPSDAWDDGGSLDPHGDWPRQG